MRAIVYGIRNKRTNLTYIGSSEQYHIRIGRHFRELRAGNHHNKKMQQDWTGDESEWQIIIFTESLSREEAYAKELELIREGLAEGTLYNILNGSSGGDAYTYNPTCDELKLKASKRLAGWMATLTPEERKRVYGRPGALNAMYGTKRPPHVIEALKNAVRPKVKPWNTGMKYDEETKRRYGMLDRDYAGEGNPFYGKQHSEKTKSDLSEKMKGKMPPNCRQVSADGKIYASVTEAARQLNVCPASVIFRINSQTPRFEQWFYIDNAQSIAKASQD